MPTGLLPLPRDVYTPPDQDGPGTGFLVSELSTQRIRLTPASAQSRARGMGYLPLNLPRVVPLEIQSNYRENILTCNGVPIAVGQSVSTMPSVFSGLTSVGVGQLVALDPGAYWDGVRIAGSTFAISPRLVPVALYDPDHFASQTRPTPVVSLRVVGFVGFFVEGMDPGEVVVGVVMPMPGRYSESAPSLTSESAFLRAIALVR